MSQKLLAFFSSLTSFVSFILFIFLVLYRTEESQRQRTLLQGFKRIKLNA